MRTELPQLTKLYSPYFGCDPELFIAQGQRIIGAEKAIPETGLPAIVLDGVQVELNPQPEPCRANLINNISAAMKTLSRHLESKDKTLSISFRQVIEVDKQELDSLGEKAKILGCAPSRNAYDMSASIRVNPAAYMKRSAGGHIHLGLNYHSGSPTYSPSWKEPPLQAALKEHKERLIPLLDVLLGNTCVLLDRDPSNVERRQVYGRAGEYRLPAHGLEYRTLSNFWLRSSRWTSFVLGMARMAVNVLANELTTEKAYQWPAVTTLLELIDMEHIRTAINTNNFDLAWKNFEAIKPFFSRHVKVGSWSLTGHRLPVFEFYLDNNKMPVVQPELTDPITHWNNIPEGHAINVGWEDLLDRIVYPMMHTATR
jgi:hypothetical protein